MTYETEHFKIEYLRWNEGTDRHLWEVFPKENVIPDYRPFGDSADSEEALLVNLHATEAEYLSRIAAAKQMQGIADVLSGKEKTAIEEFLESFDRFAKSLEVYAENSKKEIAEITALAEKIGGQQ